MVYFRILARKFHSLNVALLHWSSGIEPTQSAVTYKLPFSHLSDLLVPSRACFPSGISAVKLFPWIAAFPSLSAFHQIFNGMRKRDVVFLGLAAHLWVVVGDNTGNLSRDRSGAMGSALNSPSSLR